MRSHANTQRNAISDVMVVSVILIVPPLSNATSLVKKVAALSNVPRVKEKNAMCTVWVQAVNF